MAEREVKNPGLHFKHYTTGKLGLPGKIFSTPENIMIGTPLAGFKDASMEQVDFLAKKYKDVEWKSNIAVYMNESPLFEQLKRLFSKDRRANIFLRATFGVGNTVYGSLSGKLWRGSSYNPWAETAQIYHPRNEVGLQKLGIAEFYNSKKHEGLAGILYSLPILRTQREYRGAVNAVSKLDTKEEVKKAHDILVPLVGRFLGSDAGKVTGYILQGFRGAADVIPRVPIPGVPTNLIPFYRLSLAFDPLLFASIGALAGHIHRKIFRKDIFFDKNKKAEASSKQAPAVAPAAA